MHEWAERAVNAARRLGDAPLTAAALAVLAIAETMIGATGASRGQLARRRRRSSIRCRTTSSRATSRLATRLAGAELYLDRYAEGDVHATRALAVARATGQGELFLVLYQTLGGLWRMRGKLAEAAELLDGGIEAARLLGNTHALVWNLFSRSSAAFAMGDLDLALATAQEAVDLSARSRRGLPSRPRLP